MPLPLPSAHGVWLPVVRLWAPRGTRHLSATWAISTGSGFTATRRSCSCLMPWPAGTPSASWSGRGAGTRHHFGHLGGGVVGSDVGGDVGMWWW